MFLSQLSHQKVLPVLVLETKEQADWVGGCFVEAGIQHLEVTLRTSKALQVIEHLNRNFPELSVGAGTVLNAHQIQSAVDAGSRFIISPGATDKLLESAQDCPVPFVPGVMTPSEAMRARDYGFGLQKFFPAEAAGGIALLKAMGAPLQDIRFCPTGGITLSNMADYLELNNVPVVGGTWLVTPQALADNDRQAVVSRLNELHQALA
ncbi:bifunctional 4-hydroxy-2-oxoglutarate aldolase/2-dehydro-3-deoxy-phosphogluconate aldolase [Oceanospirillum sanctuarii]|uniref:bifunctional 4-hydroxy-2-oxoglutarate aldolase/2-dehydro-3-deoxy-phosphogluconate aldolase n=1 Tax=Oceanospirillum sanctuarii TaxID=1434821 RepID=UPI000A3C53A4|nr:bifunctional 4-hydroxy-2-oxoglutarate aldolase/2-dehydro-3-deoxy-phosphogluconate aldolase [Oceanospirillum sanctuarii]